VWLSSEGHYLTAIRPGHVDRAASWTRERGNRFGGVSKRRVALPHND
jgi:hypothetical protein